MRILNLLSWVSRFRATSNIWVALPSCTCPAQKPLHTHKCSLLMPFARARKMPHKFGCSMARNTTCKKYNCKPNTFFVTGFLSPPGRRLNPKHCAQWPRTSKISRPPTWDLVGTYSMGFPKIRDTILEAQPYGSSMLPYPR